VKKAPSKPQAARNAGSAISRMPRAVRESVSHALEDGADWRAVAKICEAAGHPGVRPMNVTNFRKGAHKDWLVSEARIEALRRDSEATAAVMRHYSENGGSPAEAGLLAASEILSRSLVGLGPEALKSLLADDPKALFGITRELSRVAELLKKTSDGHKTTLQADDKPTLTPEQRAAAMKEIFGLPT
jgi:hypothetical protein